MTTQPSTVLSAMTSSVLDAARAIGLEVAALQAQAGLSNELLDDPDGRVPIERHFALWRALSEREIGLELGSHMGLSPAGVVGYAMQHGTNVGDALDWLQRYKAVLHPDVVPRLEQRSGEPPLIAFVQIVPAAFAALREPVDAQAAALVASMELIAGRRVPPVSVALPHAAPAVLERHARVFACPITWNAAALELVFDASVLALPLARSDARLFGYLARRVEELAARLPAETVSHAARRAIEQSLAAGEPGLGSVAKALGLSERTLHRRLSAEGTGFAQLVDDARKARALLLLEDPKLSGAEIAFLLGYGEPSTFFRAFRRWTGDTPRAFRERMART